MSLLYVMNDYPSASETFVVNEAAAVRHHGVPVVGYALRRGSAFQPAAPVELIVAPPSRRELVAAGLTRAPAIARSMVRAGREGLALRELPRLALAHLHAAHVAPRARGVRVAHVHAHFLGRTADVAELIAEELGCDWTATAHGNDVYAPSDPGLLRRRFATVSGVACANRGVEACAKRWAAPRAIRTALVHCGVDTARLVASEARGHDHFVTIGRLVATKGHWTVLDAAAALMARRPTLEWTIVGDGPLRDALTSDPRSRLFEDRIHFAGALDHSATLDLLRRATAFVLPCEQGPSGESDGIPVALMEAMALGVPVVTSLVGGISELVIDDETGIIVASGDARQLEAAIERVLDPARQPDLTRITTMARAKVEEGFDLATEAARLIEFLRPHLDAVAKAASQEALGSPSTG